MRILVIGDIHGTFSWRLILEQETFDIVVFLGDYVSSERLSAKLQISNLEAILRLKENHRDKVILLRGNHDMQHLGYEWAECSGLNMAVRNEMATIKENFENNTQWLFHVDNMVFSHAGLTSTWMQSIGLDNCDIDSVNGLKPNEYFGFRSDSINDTIGTSKTQGLTWVRPGTLIQYSIPNIIQIVGHTPVSNIHKEDRPEIGASFWFCDSLPSYLVIDDGMFSIGNCNCF